MRRLAFFISVLISHFSLAQDGPYHPAATEVGTNAVSYQSAAITGWATGVDITRGLSDIANPNGPLVTAGIESAALGASDGGVVTLGDSGVALLTFDVAIQNRNGYDFAVFENGFYSPIDEGFFLELAFVEVSSDGINFVRFPAHSTTQTATQVPTYGVLDPTYINNLAGKYQSGFGTPFDLEELADSSLIDINNITHIRIVDAIGSIDPNLASFDTAGNAINDPYPTDFESGGFDLDAVAILDQTVGIDDFQDAIFQVFPTSFRSTITVQTPLNGQLQVYSLTGKPISNRSINSGVSQLNFQHLQPGVYILHFTTQNGKTYIRKCVKQ